jgi:hypothetical protein
MPNMSEPTEHPSATRIVCRALLRYVVFAPIYAPAVMLATALDSWYQGAPLMSRDWIAGFSMGALGAFAVIPGTILEAIARRSPPSLRRDVLATVLAAPVVFATITLAALQFSFTTALIWSQSTDTAFSSLEGFTKDVLRTPVFSAQLFALFAVPFVPLLFARLRGFAPFRLVATGALGTILLGWPILDAYPAFGGPDKLFIVLVSVASVLCFPLGAALADRAERRIDARLDDQP